MNDAGTRRGLDDASADPIWQIYLTYGRPNLAYAVVGIVTTLLGRLFGLVPAFIIGLAVDAIFLGQRTYAIPFVPDGAIPPTATGQLWFSIGVLLVATLLGALTSWFEDWGWGVFAQSVQHRLRVDAYARLQELDLALFTGQRTGELMSILNNDVNALETFLEDGLSSIFWVSATFLGIGAILLSLNAALALVTLLPIPLLAAFTLLFTRVIEPRYRTTRGEIGDLNVRFENAISGIEVIKTEHAEEYEEKLVEDASSSYLRANLEALKIQITYFPGLSLISGVGFALTFLVGAFGSSPGPRSA